MNKAESLAIFASMKAAFPDAVVSVAVKVSDNSTITVDGIRTGVVTTRTGTGRGGLTDSVDVSVTVLASSFADVSILRGKSAEITKDTVVTAVRLLSTKEHALGGLIKLVFGDYDRVTA